MGSRRDHSTCIGTARLFRGSGGQRGWHSFSDPVEVLRADALDEVVGLLERVEARTEAGAEAVGFVAYEAATAFDSALVTHPPRPGLPLAWFAIYETQPDRLVPLARGGTEVVASRVWQPAVGPVEHGRQVEAVRRAIDRGDTYQVNLTFDFQCEDPGSPEDLFLDLMAAQPVPHAVYLDLGRWVICSVSPELFFRREGDRLTVRPMKGTAERHADPAEDQLRRRGLLESEKDRAENLMIVDMVRNDLGRIARPGSVAVDDLYQVEGYATVWQMTSTVSASSDASLSDLFAALFPCASITGAPKPSAMSRIRALEPGPRGVYCGAVGWVGPGRRAEFNVAIRTALVDREQRRATYGVGGGIVWDSRPEAEYSEALLKGRTLIDDAPPELLETLVWRPGRGFWLLRGHLARLAQTASALGFPPIASATVRSHLEAFVRGLPRCRHKVRLRVARDGTIEVEAAPLPRRSPRPWRVGLAPHPVDHRDPRLRHKTTRRSVYRYFRSVATPDWDDVLLWNERGELTESTLANLVFDLGQGPRTPPVGSGLLPGVYRAHLLRRGELREESLELTDLEKVRAAWLINSVRGRVPIEIVRP